MKNTRTSATAEITAERERINTRLGKIRAEEQSLTAELKGIEIAERYLSGGTSPKSKLVGAPDEPTLKKARGRPRANKTDGPTTKRPRGKSESSLFQRTLEAAGVRPGQTVQEITGYINNRYKAGAKGNHVGAMLQRHAKAGRLVFSGEKTSKTWYVPTQPPQALAS